jgi:hypothetical protein
MKTRFLIGMIVSFGFIACGGESTPPNPSATQPVAASETNGQPDGVAFGCADPNPGCQCCFGAGFPTATCQGCGLGSCDQNCTSQMCWPVLSCTGDSCPSGQQSDQQYCVDTGTYTNYNVCCFNP